MVGIPWALAYVDDQQALEIEREQKAREAAGEVSHDFFFSTWIWLGDKNITLLSCLYWNWLGVFSGEYVFTEAFHRVNVLEP